LLTTAVAMVSSHCALWCVPQAFGSLGILALILTSGFAIIRRELQLAGLPMFGTLQCASPSCC
jgi:hypothetical protein